MRSAEGEPIVKRTGGIIFHHRDTASGLSEL
jgi:hypothetical protein